MEYKVVTAIISNLQALYVSGKPFVEEGKLSSELTKLAKQGWKIKKIISLPLTAENREASATVEQTSILEAAVLTILLKREKTPKTKTEQKRPFIDISD